MKILIDIYRVPYRFGGGFIYKNLSISRAKCGFYLCAFRRELWVERTA